MKQNLLRGWNYSPQFLENTNYKGKIVEACFLFKDEIFIFDKYVTISHKLRGYTNF